MGSPVRMGREYAMIAKVSIYDAARMIKEDKYANWSDEGALAIARYLSDLEKRMGREYELDLIAIRRDFKEFRNLEDIYRATGLDAYDHHRQRTLVAELDNGGFVVLDD